DGRPIDLGVALNLKPCDTAFYMVASRIWDSPNIDSSPIIDAPILDHYKRTDFGLDGTTYITENEIEGLRAEGVSIRYMYTGIVCIGRSYATRVIDDRMNEVMLGVDTGQKLEGTGDKRLNFFNTSTKKGVQAESISL